MLFMFFYKNMTVYMSPYELLYKETPNIFLWVSNSRKICFAPDEHEWFYLSYFEDSAASYISLFDFTAQKMRINSCFQLQHLIHFICMIQICFTFLNSFLYIFFILPSLNSSYHCKLPLMFWKNRQGKSPIKKKKELNKQR